MNKTLLSYDEIRSKAFNHFKNQKDYMTLKKYEAFLKQYRQHTVKATLYLEWLKLHRIFTNYKIAQKSRKDFPNEILSEIIQYSC